MLLSGKARFQAGQSWKRAVAIYLKPTKRVFRHLPFGL